MIILLRCVFEGKDELEIEKIWDIKYLVCICIKFILKIICRIIVILFYKNSLNLIWFL